MFLLTLMLLAPVQETALAVPVKWVQRDSKIKKTEFRRILDSAKWHSFWVENGGDARRIPQIDFKKYMIVTHHRRTTSEFVINPVAVRETKKAIRVVLRVDARSVWGGKHTAASPGVILVVPRSDKPVEFVRLDTRKLTLLKTLAQ